MKKDNLDIYRNSYRKRDRKDIKNIKSYKKIPKILKLIGKIFVCLTLLSIIALSVVVTALTVYVMKARETECDISLERENIEGNEFTVVYGKNREGKDERLSVIGSGVRRIWANITEVPNHVKNAFIALEDRKFYEHDGVDFWRTFGAFLNMFLHFWSRKQGGSTITQQLLKNVTGDRAVTISRKIKEIFKAFMLERKYSKDQILQAYLNIIHVGGDNGNFAGVKTAARLYFNKDIKDISIAEGACLASLVQNPKKYDMIKNPTKILDRRNYTLRCMYDMGSITKQQFEAAKRSPIVVNRGDISHIKSNYQSYFVDAALNQLASEYMKLKNIKSWSAANRQIKSNGFRVYTTIDNEMQQKLEKIYENLKFKNMRSAFVILNLHGDMIACVGGLGKKPLGDRATLNYATSSESLIGPGSTLKPFIYADFIEKNRITYSSIFKDSPFKMVQGKPWPENNDNKHSDGMVTVKYAIEKSLNTVPTKLLHDVGVEGIANICDFLKNTLRISTIVSPKSAHNGTFETSAMAMGSLTKGVILSELVNAFQIFANGGRFTPLTTLDKVLNMSGEDIFNFRRVNIRAISPDTCGVMNRLLRNVVLNGGTGVSANLDAKSIPVCGKTGTSNDGKNRLFIGCTPNYVAGIWFGSTNGRPIAKNAVNVSKLWGDIMSKLLEKDKVAHDFPFVAAKEQVYCADSGLLANPSCPKKEKGYYKRDNYLTMPCNLHR